LHFPPEAARFVSACVHTKTNAAKGWILQSSRGDQARLLTLPFFFAWTRAITKRANVSRQPYG